MKKWIYYTLIGIHAVILLVGISFLLHYFISSHQAAQTYDDLAQIVEQAINRPYLWQQAHSPEHL